LSESEAHCNLAGLYILKGKFEEAKQEYRIAREKDPSNAKALELLAKLEEPPKSREKTSGRKRLTPELEEQEHEAARREVAARFGPPGVPAADRGAASQAPPAGPFRANGQIWMPVQPAARSLPTVPAPASPTPLPTVPVPAAPTGGTAATITFDN